MEKNKLAFVGCGVIGAGLAVNAMLAGFPTALYDNGDLEVVKKSVREILDMFVENGAYTRQQADEAAARAVYTQDLAEAVKDAVFVQESIIERLDIKRDLYRQIQTLAGDKIVIGSSASNLIPTQLQEGALYPDKIVLGHPYNPSYLIPLVEIVKGEQTSQETAEFTKEVYTAMGKVSPIALKEVPSFIAQGLNSQLLLGAIKLVADGVCTAEDVDNALMYGPGMRLPIAGQLLSIGLGVKGGGWRALAQKYIGTDAPQDYLLVADQVDVEMARRPKELGNDEASIIKYRDKALVEMLRMQHRL